MATLLRIDSSPRDGNSSISRHLTAEYAERWLAANPGGKVISRDLASTSLPVVSSDWIGAAYTPEAARTAAQAAILATSDELIAELLEADEYVIGVPMFNFSIPAVLKLWIDQVARAGKTFSYAGGAPAGLLLGKKATFVTASGGVYELGSPAAAMNFVEPYLKTLFGFLGVTDVRFLNAGGTAMGAREVVVGPAMAAIDAGFRALRSAA